MIQQQPQQQQQQLSQNLAAFQSIAEAINQSGGINLSNLGSNTELFSNLAGLFTGGGGTSSAAASNPGSSLLDNLSDLLGGGNAAPAQAAQPASPGIGGLVGNLLTGFVGNRFSGRKVSKRSVDDLEFNRDEDDLKKKESLFKRKLAATTQKMKFEDENEHDEKIEGRIINANSPIYANGNENSFQADGPTRFTFFSNRDPKKITFNDNDSSVDSPTESFRFQNGDEYEENGEGDTFRIPSNTRAPKKVSFNDENNSKDGNRPSNVFFPEHDFNRGHGTKMIFPDRTGTGNLRFDKVRFESLANNRRGKILNQNNRPQQQPASFSSGHRIAFNDNRNENRDEGYGFYQRPQVNQQQTQQSNQQSTNNFFTNRYQNQNQNQNHNYNSPNRGGNRYSTDNRYGSQNFRYDQSSQNVYVTNAQGQTEYFIDPQGKKHYV